MRRDERGRLVLTEAWEHAFVRAMHENVRLLRMDVDARDDIDAALAHDFLRELAMTHPRLMASVLRKRVPYRFDGEAHAIENARVVLMERHYGACADAAAMVGAVAFARKRHAVLCMEEDETRPAYAHVRILIDGKPVEPWPERRRHVRECVWLGSVAELLEHG